MNAARAKANRKGDGFVPFGLASAGARRAAGSVAAS